MRAALAELMTFDTPGTRVMASARTVEVVLGTAAVLVVVK